MKGRVALIVGVTGQVGSYLARFLLGKGYSVHGQRRAVPRLPASKVLPRWAFATRCRYIRSPPLTPSSVRDVLERVAPAEMYNLTGQSSVGLSFSQPLETLSGIVFGTVNLLEALHRVAPKVRFYNAGSSECFGETGRYPANELTAFRPKSPYGIAKAALDLASHDLPQNPTAYSPVQASCSITSPRCGLRASSPARSPAPHGALGRAAASGSRSAIWECIAIGVGFPIMSRRCGRYCNATPRTTLSLLRVCRTRFEEFVAAAFAEVAGPRLARSCGYLTARSSARMTSHIRPVTQPRRDVSSAEDLQTSFAEIVSRMVRAEWRGAAAVS